MFGWENMDIKTVYMGRLLTLLLVVIPISVTLIIAFYLHFPRWVFILILESAPPVTSWVVCYFSPMGLRLVHLSAPFTNFAVYPAITPFSMLLIVVFIVS